ncbi:putative sensory transduction histidine kinase [Gottschalkia purinilytica]|uniref:histidine kinase n=1 Tax=Gottschalkia purinilytica TaxID=1503 RepID=A0A0L0W7W9_GOTPU|nr:HAMP domain-containing sensor histidine kinase [Gottschalkia purinilytica]KNF07673.1 putative sensory transduction histidine kinase [Gottschalkia purinilytica]
MENKIFENSEVKRIFMKVLIVLVIFYFINLAYTDMLWGELNKSLINQNLVVMGKLISKYPDEEGEIVDTFFKNANKNEVEYSVNTLKKYGYNENLNLKITPIINTYYSKYRMTNIFFFIMLMALLFIVIKMFLKNIYKKIYFTSKCAENIVEGDFSIKLPEGEEGAFSKFSHHFNQMSTVIESNLARLKDEKIFLKNILSDISHQLKTPLSSLKMFNEFMQDEDLSNEDRKKFIIKSKEQLERMEWLIKGLLKLARFEAGTIEYKKEKLLISETIKIVVEDLEVRANKKGQVIKLLGIEEKVLFLHDRKWISESISNIIKNCIEHTESGGCIKVHLEETPVLIRITISDNGKGIEKEDIPHIFERFYKGKNNIHGSGTGIGLTLSKSIIESHDGAIYVTSEKNKGTTFTITFLKSRI